jgi:hypothetical protein
MHKNTLRKIFLNDISLPLTNECFRSGRGRDRDGVTPLVEYSDLRFREKPLDVKRIT